MSEELIKHKRFRWMLQAASFLILLLLLLFMPIFKAGMMLGVFSAMALCMLLVLILSVFSISNYAGSSRPGFSWFLVWGVFALCVCAHLFLMPYMYDMDGFLSVEAGFDIFQNIELKRIVPNRLTALSIWGFFTCMWIAVWRVSWLSANQIKFLILVIFTASLFQAIYGLAHLLSEQISVLGLWDKKFMFNDATGTFVNRNHYAGMLAICWPIVIGALISQKPILFSSFASVIRVSIAIIYSLILAIALVTSHSRMGAAAAFFGIIVWGICWYRSSFNDSALISRRMMLVVIFGLTAFFAIWFGVGDILERYTQLDDGNSRLTIWASTFQLPLSAWLFGIGPGAFEDVFHLVQPEYLNVRFVYAHNDYLEFILEFGLVFSAVIFFSVLYWFMKVYPKGGFGLRAGALGAIAAVCLHSTVDFNLQIPGSAIFFWVAVGLLMNPNMVDASAGDSVDELLGSDSDDMLSDDESQSNNKPRKRKRKKVSKVPKNRRAWIAFFRSK